MIKFLAIDSSLSNTGVAFGKVVVAMDFNSIIIDEIRLHQTEKSNNKQVRASSDTIARCRSTFDFLKDIIDEFKPDIIFAETPSGSQSASGMKSYGITCQLIGALTPPPVEVTPDEVKKASIGKKTASKKEIIEWAYSNYPALEWLFKTRKGERTLIRDNEHMADAIAIAHAGIKTNQFKQLINLMK